MGFLLTYTLCEAGIYIFLPLSLISLILYGNMLLVGFCTMLVITVAIDYIIKNKVKHTVYKHRSVEITITEEIVGKLGILLGAMCVYIFYNHPFFILFTLAGTLNTLAVAFNGGKMPVIKSVLDNLKEHPSIKHCYLNSNTRLKILTDIIKLDKKAAVSIGDLILFLAFWFYNVSMLVKILSWTAS